MKSEQLQSTWVNLKAEILNPDEDVGPLWWILFFTGWVLIAIAALLDG